MKSIFDEEILPKFKRLTKNIKTDVLIIGAGLTGLITAYLLRCNGIKCTVVEAKRVMSGVSVNSTAKLTLLHGAVYHKIMKRYGLETAKKYFELNEKSVKRLSDIAKKADCDFLNSDAVLYSISNTKLLEAELTALKKCGCNDAYFSDKLELDFKNAGGIVLPNQAQFNPKKLAKYLLNDIEIYENTRITSISNSFAFTDTHKIYAPKIIVCTHFPIMRLSGLYAIKMHQSRSHVLMLKDVSVYDKMYISADEGGYSFRQYDDMMLISGAGHRTGEKMNYAKKLREFAANHYEGARPYREWATQDCITLDNMPYVGRISRSMKNVYVATGYNKWGMSSSMAAASVLCDMILLKPNDYADILNPSRTIMHKRLIGNIGHSLKGLLTPTAPRCSHLGCALKWNKYEHSWDCSCHGSRFDFIGNVLDDPANRKLK